MSYVVKGYEFPKSCRECWLIYPEVGDSGECIFTDKFWENEEDRPSKSRLPKCPLVEIPTPHGRLIDADNLVKVLQDTLDNYPDNYNDEKAVEKLIVTVCKRYIESAPTVIEAEASE